MYTFEIVGLALLVMMVFWWVRIRCPRNGFGGHMWSKWRSVDDLDQKRTCLRCGLSRTIDL